MGNAVILAAGKGTRMISKHAKVMQKVLGEPMIGHIADHLENAGIDRIVTVVGYKGEEIREYLGTRSEYAVQEPQLGSGHAVMMADALKNEEGKTLIVNGDCPLISAETYKEFLNESEGYDLTVLTMVCEDPGSYGRILRDKNGDFLRITEFKDCNEEEKKITEVNAGIYCADNQLLWKYLPEIRNENAQKEYYVTDLVQIFLSHGKKIGAVIAKDPDEMMGINDRKMLA
ncbi:MAG: NTP transferase domain-containing protein, partial [Erysipelotrichales bacterium]|nr:NTP transferase domain-containing protein [Erysipelotrichales bacterium]